ncbi:hypothetical protein [Flavobacterium sp. UMI-01]|uniref:hypothetical protein n=1 Tax=Flavobacterium sp. UMI-01 TaxID=1441053 RepID=UPI001C7E140E|nr:hypothetical protein [Flavobacterium sp. UMI-01]GIZ10255.1 hypothetical protein FUMI01_29790 [Flavobacterium sp. UMI-01]
MTKEAIVQRLEDLHNVLAYCSDIQSNGKIYVFKLGERICINQERGALLSQISHSKGEIFPHEVRTYTIPPQIEAKVKFTVEKIQSTNWGGHNLNDFINI